jgi:hypothetical protein
MRHSLSGKKLACHFTSSEKKAAFSGVNYNALQAVRPEAYVAHYFFRKKKTCFSEEITGRLCGSEGIMRLGFLRADA